MTNPISLRQGTKEDCQAVLVLMQAAFAEYKDWLIPESGVFYETVETLIHRLSQDTLLLAVEDEDQTERLVGSIFCAVQPDGNMYLSRLSVLPAYRKQGLGRMLIAEVETIAQQNKCPSVTLGVRIALEANVQYFQSLGYCEISRHAHDGFHEPTYLSMAKRVHAE
ncbi:MAG: GNAT family N-acetyltransferase [Chloroflexota bacterium]